MKKQLFGAILTLGVVATVNTVKAQTVSDFETVLSGNDTIWKGADLSAGKVSGAGFFLNDYNAQWGSWSGFAVSKTTDTVNGTWGNQFSCIAGSGAHGSSTYAVSYSYSTVVMTHSSMGDSIYGLSINNSTYTYKTIKNGDNFSKKFGGTTGNDPDFYSAIFYGYDADFNLTDSVVFYLADYRDANNNNDYIVKDWTWVDLSKLGRIRYLDITFNSTDKGAFGINTPTYACIDSLVYKNSSSAFQPLAAIYDYKVGFNTASKNYNVTKHSINPGNTTDSLTATLVSQPSNGVAMLVNDSIISYAPKNGFNGYDTVWYSVCNQSSLCDTGWMTFLVNDAPVAMVDTFTRSGDGVEILDVLANDSDEQKSKLRVSILDTAKQGAIAFVANKLEYIPATDFEGKDTCSYLICDPFGACDTGFVYITIRNLSSVESHTVSRVKAFPNPTTGSVYFTEKLPLNAQIRVVNVMGDIVPVSILSNDEIDLSNLNDGLYFIEIQGEADYTELRVVKQ